MVLLNKETIQRLSIEVGEQNVPMLLEIFISELTSYISTLSSGESLLPLLGEISHKLKSSASSFGADDLRDLAFQIDKKVKLGQVDNDDLEPMVDLLRKTEEAYLLLIAS